MSGPKTKLTTALVPIGANRMGWVIDLRDEDGRIIETTIAQIFANPDDAKAMGRAEEMARTFSAAPELLQATKRFVAHFVGGSGRDPMERPLFEAIEAAKEAIAKAEGK